MHFLYYHKLEKGIMQLMYILFGAMFGVVAICASCGRPHNEGAADTTTPASRPPTAAMKQKEQKGTIPFQIEGKWDAEIWTDGGYTDSGICTVNKGHIEIRGSIPGNLWTYDYRLPGGPVPSAIDLVESDKLGKHLRGAWDAPSRNL